MIGIKEYFRFNFMIQDVIKKVEIDLTDTFNRVFDWFNCDMNLQKYKPANGGWNINEVLEHIAITNHYLLILIRKATVKSVEKAKSENFGDLILNYDLDWSKLKTIGEHKSFEWNRPAHMEPTGNISLNEVKIKLQDQLNECLNLLSQVSNGEGVLHKTTMSVNGLGKIDVYHYFSFLSQHSKRHLEQMEKINLEFKNSKRDFLKI